MLETFQNLGETLSASGRAPAGAVRNRNVRIGVGSGIESIELMVKSFGAASPLKDWIDARRGSKARRTWQAAAFLERSGVGTPPAVGFLERWAGGRLAESYFLSVFQPGVASLRDELIRLFREDPECERFMNLLQCVADAIRAMHAAGFLHNDLGNQNILLRRKGPGEWDAQFVDLNRGRAKGRLSLRRRARDISRLYLPSDFLRVFKDMYFGHAKPPGAFERWERFYRRAYAVHCATRRYRHPLRTLNARLHPAPAKAEYPRERDMWVWDERSAQAVNALERRDRHRHHRLVDHVGALASAVAMAPAVRRHYRALKRDCFRSRVPLMGRVGMAVCGEPDVLDREIGLLTQLGSTTPALPVLVRFYRHKGKASWNAAAKAVRTLRGRGHSVAIGLVQDRRAVLEPECWEAFVADVLEQVASLAEWVEAGHAVNRIKWGIWTRAEHRRLLEATARAVARYPGVRLMGPAAIDFEYAALAAALGNVPRGLSFDALSQHLYVDRHGAPESRRGGLSAVKKFALARALGRVSGACEDRLIVSEVNWPLKGMSVHSPVGSPYEVAGPRFNDPSVTEDEYGDYMIRYLVLALCSGMVERVYWWRLAARGFGLVDDTDPGRWRERAAFHMLRRFLEVLGESVFLGVRPERAGIAGSDNDGELWFLFERQDGERVCLAYTPGCPIEAPPPLEFARVEDAFGRVIWADLRKVSLSGRPVYLRGCRDREGQSLPG